MEHKTKVNAEDGKQEILITREFNIAIDLLFKAYIEPQIVEEWMGTKVIKLDSRNHGSYQFETADKNGNIVLRSNGVIHKVVENKTIIRTFEMENTPFPVQLEYLEFEKVTDEKSILKMKVIYKSVEIRDQILKLPFAFGINMAHDKLENHFKNN